MKRMISGIGALVIMVVMMVSCSQAPQVEMDAANAALETAKTVEADRYLAAEFTALNDSLAVVVSAVEAEKEKSASARNFKPLAEKLNAITTSAEELAARTETVKAETRDQVQNEVAAVTLLLDNTKVALGKIVKNRKNADQLDEFANQITVIEATLLEVNTLITNGDYLTALEKITTGKMVAYAVIAQL
jgi:hypothetical protein